MANTSHHQPSWDTASLGLPADMSALKHGALTEHLTECGARRRRLHHFRSGADGLRQLAAARVVTSALVLSLLLGISWLLR